MQKSGRSRSTGAANSLRIIGGDWRRRRIRFEPAFGLRPTPDRVRETLFNWLASRVAGSRCLDLFAGSGALGLEALSRGAAHCLFVERDRAVADCLRATVGTLAPERGAVIQRDALEMLAGPARRFDIVFLDPPFGSGLATEAMQRLESGGWLAPAAAIYIEMPARDGPPRLPAGWTLHRTGRAGAVGYHLALRRGQDGVRPT